MRLLAIVPCFNEEATVGQVVKEIKAGCPGADVLVINDGSSDKTERAAIESGAKVATLPYNMGIGAAMQVGYRYALARDYDFAVQVDGDGQHDPMELPKILKPIKEDTADFVVGSRFLGGVGFKSTPVRRLGITIFSSVLSVLTRVKLSDPTSGFRAANRKVISLFACVYSDDYPEVESLFLVYLSGLRTIEKPVAMHSRMEGKSSITFLRSIYYMIKVTMVLFIWLLRKKPRLED